MVNERGVGHTTDGDRYTIDITKGRGQGIISKQ